MAFRSSYLLAGLCCALWISACGGGSGGGGGKGGGDGDDPSTVDGGDPDGSGKGDGDGDGDGRGDGDGDGHGDGDGDENPDGGTSPNCKTECDPDDCGEFVSDNCGGHLVCRNTCLAGQICGVLRPDKCDYPPPVECTPKTPEEVCAGKCGAVEDGCSGVVNCSGKNGGIDCGANQYCQNAVCVDKPTCQKLPIDEACDGKCGMVSDGCSGVYTCDSTNGGISCGVDEICDQQSNSCVDVPPSTVCKEKTIAEACDGTCGQVSDGCEGFYDCEANGFGCSGGETCGGGGTPGQCGSGETACPKVPEEVACAGKCGFVPDGCGGGYNCDSSNGGVTCDPNRGEVCGGEGKVNQCVSVCKAKTPAEVCTATGVNKSCGEVPDGCGGTIDCGGCAQNQECGLGGANHCGTIPTCTKTPRAQACAGKCGEVPDGCEGSYQCNGTNGGVTCTGDEWCGAREPNKCGGPPPSACVPKTCAQLGHSCGLASDGCGNRINCWSGCAANDPDCVGTCGELATCMEDEQGKQACVSGTQSCTGDLCDSLPTNCGSNSPTRLTGTVRTPGRQDDNDNWINQLPVPNALVYIPASYDKELPEIRDGVTIGDPLSCGRCQDEQLVAEGDSVLAATVTDYRGQFTLEGRIPVNTDFRLVIKVGKWRRVVKIPKEEVSACQENHLDLKYTRLNRDSTDGESGTQLPKIAISTGDVDEMECVFRNMGISESEFTVPSGTGRIHMYRANGARMRTRAPICKGQYDGNICIPFVGCNKVSCSANNNWGCNNNRSGCYWEDDWIEATVSDQDLFASQNTINQYDMVVFDCEGRELWESDSERERVRNYVDNGGRMFASHFSYTWIEGNGSLDDSADWGTDGTGDIAVGYISMPSGPTQRPGANDSKAAVFRNWLDYEGALVGSIAGGNLENPSPPRMTIADPRDRAGANVGAHTDEWIYREVGRCSNDDDQLCSSNEDCRTCSNNSNRFCKSNSDCPGASATCRSAGSSGTGTCQNFEPRVQQLSFNTPYGADEDHICGRVTYSGFHVANASNSNSYFPDVCSNGPLSAQEKVLAFMLFDLTTCVSEGDPPQPPSCTAKTAAQVCPNENDACGYLSDGCGGVVDCGGCSDGYYCDGNECRVQECTPATCASLGFNCGEHADGCGGVARNAQGQEGCGTCVGNQQCGLGGPGVCGTATCPKIPESTACPPNSCGIASDGCGGTYNCGGCPEGEVCGGGGPNLCGPGSCPVIPKETACAGKNCGLVSDGCGGSYDCGTCTPPDSCGGGGQANVCGHPPCDKLTQDEACEGKECGWVSDGCGGAIYCGTCPNGGVCGGNGPNLCGDTCEPTTCAEQKAECGAISDHCGGVLNCGSCAPGLTCGAAGPNKCGSGPSCEPRTCEEAGAECGLIGDGCGGVLNCGDCTEPGETCGGAGVPNQCGPGTGGCNKLTCEAQNVECGAASDGCGGVLDCGGCPNGYQCKGSKCEELPPVIF